MSAIILIVILGVVAIILSSLLLKEYMASEFRTFLSLLIGVATILAVINITAMEGQKVKRINIQPSTYGVLFESDSVIDLLIDNDNIMAYYNEPADIKITNNSLDSIYISCGDIDYFIAPREKQIIRLKYY